MHQLIDYEAGDDLQMVDLPRDIFHEASLTAQKLEISDTGILTVSEKGSEILEGLTAEVLSMLATDSAQLSLPACEVKPFLQNTMATKICTSP